MGRMSDECRYERQHQKTITVNCDIVHVPITAMIVERLCTVDQLLFRLARHTHNRHRRQKHQQRTNTGNSLI